MQAALIPESFNARIWRVILLRFSMASLPWKLRQLLRVRSSFFGSSRRGADRAKRSWVEWDEMAAR